MKYGIFVVFTLAWSGGFLLGTGRGDSSYKKLESVYLSDRKSYVELWNEKRSIQEELTSATVNLIRLNRENWVLHGQLEIIMKDRGNK